MKSQLSNYYKKGWVIIAILIGILYIRYAIIMILRDTSFTSDILLYFTVLIAIVTRRVYNYSSIGVLCIFAALAIINPASKNIFLILLTVYLLAPLSLQQIASINLSFQLIILLWVSCMLLFGELELKNYTNTYELDTRSNRWDFGFGNPNIFALFIYAVIINMYVLLEKYKLFNFIYISTISLVITIYTSSRSFQLAMFIFILSQIFISVNGLQKIVFRLKPLLYIIPFIFMIGTLYFSINAYSFPEVNLLLSGRLALYNSLISNSSYLQFIIGNPEVMEELIDSVYIHLLFEGGILAFLCFAFLYIMYIRHLNAKSILYLPILMSSLVYGLTESVFTSILNYGAILVWSILYNSWLNSHIKYENT